MREQDKQKTRSGQNRQKVRSGQNARNGQETRKVQGEWNRQTARGGRDMPKGQTRTELLCPVEKKCGGCRGFSQSYEQHLKQKEKNVQELCKTVKKWEPIMGM